VAANAEIRSTNPGVNRDANTDTVMLHMVEGLVGYKDDGTPAPLLAQSIDVSRTARILHLQAAPGVKFHNGRAAHERRRRLVVEALPRPEHEVALPRGVRRLAEPQDREASRRRTR
jgi:ABC-type transport system substrate-binding protein